MESEGGIRLLVFLMSTIFLVGIVFLFIVLSYVQKKKMQFIHEKEKARANFEEQLLRTEVEITDQNLKNISWELHDNVGQLLSVASMEAKMLMQKNTLSGDDLEEVVNVLGQSIAQVRGLSKTLNSEMIQKLGLKEALENEFGRLERIGLIKTTLQFNDVIIRDKKKEIIIFRMLQEFISNVIKHAQASELNISVSKKDGQIHILATDNGVGFDRENVEGNNGLLNLESRAKLIEADLKLDSKIGEGTTMKLIFDNEISSHEKI